MPVCVLHISHGAADVHRLVDRGNLASADAGRAGNGRTIVEHHEQGIGVKLGECEGNCAVVGPLRKAIEEDEVDESCNGW